MARMLWLTVAVFALLLSGVAARAQRSVRTSGTPDNRPPALDMLRAQMKKLMDMQAQVLADEIGSRPGNCRVDVSHIEDDELGEGFTEFVVDVFERAHWNVEVAAVEQLACATPGIAIQFSPPAAAVAALLQGALGRRERTDVAPLWVDDPQSCNLRVTVGPQFPD